MSRGKMKITDSFSQPVVRQPMTRARVSADAIRRAMAQGLDLEAQNYPMGGDSESSEFGPTPSPEGAPAYEFGGALVCPGCARDQSYGYMRGEPVEDPGGGSKCGICGCPLGQAKESAAPPVTRQDPAGGYPVAGEPAGGTGQPRMAQSNPMAPATDPVDEAQEQAQPPEAAPPGGAPASPSPSGPGGMKAPGPGAPGAMPGAMPGAAPAAAPKKNPVRTQETWGADGKFSREVEADGVDDLVRLHQQLNQMGLTKSDAPQGAQPAPGAQQPGMEQQSQAWAGMPSQPMQAAASMHELVAQSGSWWDKMSPEQQQKYREKHPKSKQKPSGGPGKEGPSEAPVAPKPSTPKQKAPTSKGEPSSFEKDRSDWHKDKRNRDDLKWQGEQKKKEIQKKFVQDVKPGDKIEVGGRSGTIVPDPQIRPEDFNSPDPEVREEAAYHLRTLWGVESPEEFYAKYPETVHIKWDDKTYGGKESYPDIISPEDVQGYKKTTPQQQAPNPDQLSMFSRKQRAQFEGEPKDPGYDEWLDDLEPEDPGQEPPEDLNKDSRCAYAAYARALSAQDEEGTCPECGRDMEWLEDDGAESKDCKNRSCSLSALYDPYREARKAGMEEDELERAKWTDKAPLGSPVSPSERMPEDELFEDESTWGGTEEKTDLHSNPKGKSARVFRSIANRYAQMDLDPEDVTCTDCGNEDWQNLCVCQDCGDTVCCDGCPAPHKEYCNPMNPANTIPLSQWMQSRGIGAPQMSPEPEPVEGGMEQDAWGGRGRGRGGNRYPCPSCGKPDAISQEEKSKGYQCQDCTRRDEGGEAPGGWYDASKKTAQDENFSLCTNDGRCDWMGRGSVPQCPECGSPTEAIVGGPASPGDAQDPLDDSGDIGFEPWEQSEPLDPPWKHASKRTAQPKDMPPGPAAAAMNFEHSNERSDGDRVVWDLSWNPEDFPSAGETQMKQYIRSYVQRDATNVSTKNWGLTADCVVEDIDTDAGIATVTFQTSEQAAPQVAPAEATE